MKQRKIQRQALPLLLPLPNSLSFRSCSTLLFLIPPSYFLIPSPSLRTPPISPLFPFLSSSTHPTAYSPKEPKNILKTLSKRTQKKASKHGNMGCGDPMSPTIIIIIFFFYLFDFFLFLTFYIYFNVFFCFFIFVFYLFFLSSK